MRVLVTAGPTREYLDDVRFLTNASSGRMGCAVAAAAVAAGHEVTLLIGPVALEAPAGCDAVRFTSVEDLAAALGERFADCDALVMAAAVGDFRPEQRCRGKIPRRGGPVTVRLIPTPDVLASVARGRGADQRVVAFAVEAPPRDAAAERARAELAAKGADMVVVNMPSAMGAADSEACILTADAVLAGWARRAKAELAELIVGHLHRPG